MRRKDDGRNSWDAIVLTCQRKTSARAIQKELEVHQSKGFIGKDVVLITLEDPKGGVGSGGATLNALLVVTEHLSAKAGFRVVTESVLENARILIMHLGFSFPFSSCGRFFNQLPAKHSEESKENLCDSTVLNFDLVLYILSNTLSLNAPPGVWICSSDMIPSIPLNQRINWEQCSGGTILFLSQGDVQYAKDHGVAKLGEDGNIKDIIFRESEDKIKSFALENGKVPVVSGWVYMSSRVAFKVLSLHVYHPLDACSYYGLDNGAEAIQLSMIFDILLCMAEDVIESAFVDGDRSGTYSKRRQVETSRTAQQEAMLMRSARAQLWNNLRGLQLKGVLIENGSFNYMKASAECYRRQMLESPQILQFSGLPYNSSNVMHVTLCKNGTLSDRNHVPESCIVINSNLDDVIKIGENSVITNCELKGDITIGQGSVFVGVSSDIMKDVPAGFAFPDELCVMQFKVCIPKLSDKAQQVLVVMGVHDDFQLPFSSPKSTYCNKPWETFFKEAGNSPEEIWFGVREDERCLWNARLFPVVHFFSAANENTGKDDMLWLAMATCGALGSSNKRIDTNRNFRQDLNVGKQKLEALPQQLSLHLKGWRSSLRLSLKEIMALDDLPAEFEWTKKLWFQIGKAQVEDTLRNCRNECLLPFFRSCIHEGFEKDLLETLDHVASSTSSPGVAARTLACVADVLGAMAGERAGLRSGPARNESWMEALEFLEKEDTEAGVKRLAKERNLWFDRPDLLIRAARHYEGAEQILRRQAVFTAKKFFDTEECEALPMGDWVYAEAPARVDLSGCWTDTPPITYEHGGAVLTAAINLNGKKVMGAKVRKIPEFEIVLVIHAGEHSVKVVCSELSDLENYAQPHAPGALLKACFCLLDIVTLPSNESLPEQLRKRFKAGFELHTWSIAPQGSGLGTSSILAGVILAALLRATGRKASLDSLVHAVLLIEQMLTTGGGWQDNAGGLFPGFKMTRSKDSLPLKVEVEQLNLSQETVDKFTERLICLYSGKPRLAKNLLQDVVRNWYARFPQITRNADELISNAEEAATALKEGDIEKLGACISCYRKQKCIMAPGTEPDSIHEVMEAIDPLVLGQTLTGAGGGGFLVLITKEPNMADKVKAVIQEKKASDDFTFYDVSVDWEGLTVRVESSHQGTS